MGAPAEAEAPPRPAHGAARRGGAARGRTLSAARYRVTQLARKPRAAYYRRKFGPDLDPAFHAMLELHSYRASLFSFIEATAADPDLLITAPLDASSVVIDGGAYVGEWSQRVHDRYGSHIAAFEPSPLAFAQLEQALGSTEGIELHQVGLGGADAAAELVEAGPGASIYDLTPTGVTAGNTTVVSIRDVVALFAELGIDHVDLLKLNIEGGEYDVLDRLVDAGWLDRIEVVSVQFHEWHPDAHRRRRRIRRALSATHDETWCHEWVWERWTRRR